MVSTVHKNTIVILAMMRYYALHKCDHIDHYRHP